jgi:hypothetical protein
MELFKNLNFYILLIVLIFSSCTDPKKVKVSDPNVYKYIDKICYDMDRKQEAEFRKNFKEILLMEANGDVEKYSVAIYNKRYKDLTLEDVLYNKKRHW